MGKSLWTDAWPAMKACLEYFRGLEGSAFSGIFELKGVEVEKNIKVEKQFSSVNYAFVKKTKTPTKMKIFDKKNITT